MERRPTELAACRSNIACGAAAERGVPAAERGVPNPSAAVVRNAKGIMIARSCVSDRERDQSMWSVGPYAVGRGGGSIEVIERGGPTTPPHGRLFFFVDLHAPLTVKNYFTYKARLRNQRCM